MATTFSSFFFLSSAAIVMLSAVMRAFASFSFLASSSLRLRVAVLVLVMELHLGDVMVQQPEHDDRDGTDDVEVHLG
jgi:hypothetical protein